MDPNYLYPNYTPFPHLLSAPSTTSTSSPYATPFSTPYTTPTLPTLTAPTTGPSTPDASATPIDTYECHLFPPPQPQLLPSIPSISPPDPLSTGLSDSTTLSKQSPIKLSPLFPVADTMASSASPSSTSPPPTSANIHHQSHPHLFPEQISPGGNPESSRSATTNTGVTAASENVAYRPPSSTSSHAASYQAGPGISGGPALQATHPSADIYRHRSASPWVSQHHQQQPHQQNQQHQSPLNPSTDYPDSSNAYNASTSHALSMFNNPQHTYGGSHSHYSLNQSHYPLNVSHTSMEYSFPPANPTTTAHYGSTTMQHDPYHSPDQQRAILPYGYPIQSQIYHHPHHTGTSSLLDKHLTSDLRSSGSYGISNSLSHYGASLNNSNKFAERYTSSLKTEQQTNMTSRTARTAGTIKSATRPIRTATSGSNNTSNNSKRSTSIEQQGVNDKTADCTTTGISTSGGTIITPSGPNGSTSINHGIVDESNTTLWDLKDGQEGPRGKPRKLFLYFPSTTRINIQLTDVALYNFSLSIPDS